MYYTILNCVQEATEEAFKELPESNNKYRNQRWNEKNKHHNTKKRAFEKWVSTNDDAN